MRPSNELYTSFGNEKKRELTKSRRPYVCEVVEEEKERILNRIRGATIISNCTTDNNDYLLLITPSNKNFELVMDKETSNWLLVRWYFKAHIKDQNEKVNELINKMTTELYILQEHEEERKSEVHLDLSFLHYRHLEFNKMLNKMIKWEEQELREWELLHEDK